MNHGSPTPKLGWDEGYCSRVHHAMAVLGSLEDAARLVYLIGMADSFVMPTLSCAAPGNPALR